MELTFKSTKSLEFIWNYLTDMEKFVSIHPVITKIDSRGNDYLVHETLKMGFIPFSFTYPVTIEPNLPERLIVFKARVMKLTEIEMVFSLKEVDGFSVVEEKIHFRSPLPIKGIMQRIFKKQHEQLFKNMDRL